MNEADSRGPDTARNQQSDSADHFFELTVSTGHSKMPHDEKKSTMQALKFWSAGSSLWHNRLGVPLANPLLLSILEQSPRFMRFPGTLPSPSAGPVIQGNFESGECVVHYPQMTWICAVITLQPRVMATTRVRKGKSPSSHITGRYDIHPLHK
jgi:hypothetical protein